MTIDEAIKWEKIKDFPNYSISSTGLVRNDITGHIKIPRYDKNGYVVYGLYDHQKRKEKKAHRLIAEAFISNPEGKPFVNHINGIKDDNRIENLEWCSASENNYHAWNVLDSEERRNKMAEHSHNRIWSEESREKMRNIAKNRVYTEEIRNHMSEAHKRKGGYRKTPVLCVETGIVYPSITRASEDIEISKNSICNVLSGLSENARGYHFRRVV